MATLNGIPINAVLHVLRIGERGREGAESLVNGEVSQQFWDALQSGEPVTYEGEIVEADGTRYQGRMAAVILGFNPASGGGSVITFKGTGAPERL